MVWITTTNSHEYMCSLSWKICSVAFGRLIHIRRTCVTAVSAASVFAHITRHTNTQNSRYFDHCLIFYDALSVSRYYTHNHRNRDRFETLPFVFAINSHRIAHENWVLRWRLPLDLLDVMSYRCSTWATKKNNNSSASRFELKPTQSRIYSYKIFGPKRLTTYI